MTAWEQTLIQITVEQNYTIKKNMKQFKFFKGSDSSIEELLQELGPVEYNRMAETTLERRRIQIQQEVENVFGLTIPKNLSNHQNLSLLQKPVENFLPQEHLNFLKHNEKYFAPIFQVRMRHYLSLRQARSVPESTGCSAQVRRLSP